jgi:hypothetical protein
MNVSIRNHYLPQFYLKSFTDPEGKFWVYYKDRDEPVRQTPVNTGIEKHMYTIEREDGTIDDVVEKKMFAPLESEVSPIIKKLTESKYNLTDVDKENLSLFLAFMVTRVPRSIEVIKEIGEALSTHTLKEFVKDEDEVKKAFEHLKGEGKLPKDFTLDDMNKMLRDSDKNYRIEMERKYATGMSLFSTIAIYKLLRKMNFCLCRAPSGEYFITSDFPVTSFLPFPDGTAIFGGGFGKTDVEICFPLSPEKCLFLDNNHNNRFWAVHKSFVFEMNRRIAWSAEKFILSHLKTNYNSYLRAWSSKTLEYPKMDKHVLTQKFNELNIPKK